MTASLKLNGFHKKKVQARDPLNFFLNLLMTKVLVENQIGLNSYNSGLLNSFIIKFRYNAR